MSKLLGIIEEDKMDKLAIIMLEIGFNILGTDILNTILRIS
jgi:hypothetical protein